MPPKDSTAFAVILGGGAGTRLWPSSRRARPKQLLSLGTPESLIGAAVRRGSALVGVENTLIVTAEDQAAAVRAAIPDLPAANIVAEPVPGMKIVHDDDDLVVGHGQRADVGLVALEELGDDPDRRALPDDVGDPDEQQQ